MSPLTLSHRRVGDQIADTFVDAFVTGILAGDARLLVSAPPSRAWPTGKEIREASPPEWPMHGVCTALGQAAMPVLSTHGPRPGPFPVAWPLSSKPCERLRQPPIVGVNVRRVMRGTPHWQVEAEGREAWSADAVVLCCPAYAQAEILADLDHSLAEQIAGIVYNRVTVVALGYRREDVPHSLDGFGYLSPQRQQRDVLGVQWCSSIFPGRGRMGWYSCGPCAAGGIAVRWWTRDNSAWSPLSATKCTRFSALPLPLDWYTLYAGRARFLSISWVIWPGSRTSRRAKRSPRTVRRRQLLSRRGPQRLRRARGRAGPRRGGMGSPRPVAQMASLFLP